MDTLPQTPAANAALPSPPGPDACCVPVGNAGDGVRYSESYAHDKAKILNRLKRIEGQVRGVQRMVDEDQYCLDVLTQLSAIIAGAKATGLLLLEDHIRGCVINADAKERDAVMTELTEAIARFTRSVG